MKNVKIAKLWDSLHSSYWFLPTIVVVGAIALAIVMLTLDREGYYGPLESWGWVDVGSTDGAREVLSSIAGSMITVAATAFSITIVALQLAAANFGPRLLRNFMQDTGNQIVLGTFISTFIYCLLVLRTIRGDGDDYDKFIPQLSTTVGTALALVSIGMLIYFIHHASTIIQASHVISEAGADLDRAIDRLFPDRIGVDEPEFKQPLTEIPENFDAEAYPIKAPRSGYVQAIDDDELMKIACRDRLLLRINYRPGKFAVKDQVLVTAYPQERVNRKLTSQISDRYYSWLHRRSQKECGAAVSCCCD